MSAPSESPRPPGQPPEARGLRAPEPAGVPGPLDLPPRPAPRRLSWRRRRPPALPSLSSRPSPGRLRRHRRTLLRRRQDALFHLGGLAFELYRRNRLTDDVLRLRAAEVADLDRSVGEIDLWLEEVARVRQDGRDGAAAPPAVGACLRCRAPFRADARFCARCGAALTAGGAASEQVTAVIGAGSRPGP